MTPLEYLTTVPPGTWVSQSPYLYYGCLSGHAIGMGVVVGLTYIFALRALGFSKGTPIDVFAKLGPAARYAFFLNLLTGVLLFTANAHNLAQNAPFLIKIAFVVLAGGLTIAAFRSIGAGAVDGDVGGRTKALAVLAALGWTVAIVAGRTIAYTIKY